MQTGSCGVEGPVIDDGEERLEVLVLKRPHESSLRC